MKAVEEIDYKELKLKVKALNTILVENEKEKIKIIGLTKDALFQLFLETVIKLDEEEVELSEEIVVYFNELTAVEDEADEADEADEVEEDNDEADEVEEDNDEADEADEVEEDNDEADEVEEDNDEVEKPKKEKKAPKEKKVKEKKTPKEKKEKKGTRKVTVFGTGVESQGGQIEKFLIKGGMTVADMANKIGTTEGRIRNHFNYLKAKRGALIIKARNNKDEVTYKVEVETEE